MTTPCDLPPLPTYSAPEEVRIHPARPRRRRPKFILVVTTDALLAGLAADDRLPPTVVIAPSPAPARYRDRAPALMVLTPPVAVETLLGIVQEHVLTPTTTFGA